MTMMENNGLNKRDVSRKKGVLDMLSQQLFRSLLWLMSHLMYRVKHRGLKNIPQHGGAVLVCNHVSFVDALLISSVVERPVRFVMDKRIYQSPMLNWFFRLAKTIPICSQKQDPKTFRNAFDAIDDALTHGEIVCIFPEGKLTRDGALNTFRPGIEKIIGRNPVPVVPMALRGLWGSFFSHEGKGVFNRGGGRFWSRVEVEALPLVPSEKTTAGLLEDKVLSLSASSFRN